MIGDQYLQSCHVQSVLVTSSPHPYKCPPRSPTSTLSGMISILLLSLSLTTSLLSVQADLSAFRPQSLSSFLSLVCEYGIVHKLRIFINPHPLPSQELQIQSKFSENHLEIEGLVFRRPHPSLRNL